MRVRLELIGLMAVLSFAAKAEESVPASPSAVPDTVGSLASLGLGLLVVIGMIFGCAWLVRRMSGLTGMNNQAMKVVSVMNLGARERIVLMDVGGKQILVGITPSTIRTLHVFDEPITDAGSQVSGDFARKLQGMIGRSWKGSPSDSGDSR